LNHARSALPYQTYRDFGKPALDPFVCQTAISMRANPLAVIEIS